MWPIGERARFSLLNPREVTARFRGPAGQPRDLQGSGFEEKARVRTGALTGRSTPLTGLLVSLTRAIPEGVFLGAAHSYLSQQRYQSPGIGSFQHCMVA
jgi:hypothetical protein